MPTNSTGQDEDRRRAALEQYAILDTGSEAEFDHIVEFAARLFQVPIALIAFIDRDRWCIKSSVGLALLEGGSHGALCAQVLSRSDDLLVIPDTAEDADLKGNALILSKPFIRFYAAALLVTPEGEKIGTILLLDTEPHPLVMEAEKATLKTFATLTMDHLERRRASVLTRAFSRMAAAMPDAFVCFSDEGLITFWNPAAERVFGHTRDAAMGQPIELIMPKFREALREKRQMRQVEGSQDRAQEREGDRRALEVQGLRQDQTTFPLDLSLTFWREEGRGFFGAIMHDLSKDHHKDKHLRYLTHFDPLTDLPNRVQFIETIESELERSRPFSLLKVGLDEFKRVNGSVGMAVGDAVLRTIATRICKVVPSFTFVARLGSDEFGILMRGLSDAHQAKALAHDILSTIGEPCHVLGFTCHLSASVGIVLNSAPKSFSDANAVLKAALLALYKAKLEGGRRYMFFQSSFGLEAEQRSRLDGELRLAWSRGEFELFFQPQVQLATNHIVGAEALLRWHHPERGLLLPGSFLHALEMSDIAVEVGRWIINKACAFGAEMFKAGSPLRVSVNLFCAQLKDETLYATVTSALLNSNLPPDLFELEITETTVLNLEESVIDPLRRLRKLGVGIAFDDYGTGFGSLSLLKRYPLSRLKIDMEFVRGLMTDPDDAAIVKAVLALGRSMGFHVIAEGIETDDQAAKLQALRCEEVQGFLYGKPMPAPELSLRLMQQAGSVSAA